MTASILNPTQARHADAAALALSLTEQRTHTLALFDAIERALGGRLDIAYDATVNPPLWELGHVGWFEEFWIARNPQRLLGPRASVHCARAAALLPGADALYDSSHVAHASRWRINLPDAQHTRALLAHTRERTLALLSGSRADDDALYFFRLALQHEAMHHEAGLMIAQTVGLDVASALPPRLDCTRRERSALGVAGACLTLGEHHGGFAFDNELGEHTLEIGGFHIDACAVRWRDMLPFIDDGAYSDATLWSAEGWAWRQRALPHALPRPMVRDEAFEHGLKYAAFGRWLPLPLDAPAQHLSEHEAQAWCRWVGRRLPTEPEWMLAQQQHGERFACGEVWEWTASPFAPWPGFAPHAYRDYSAPWFDGRPVLKGGSWATRSFMKDVRYRNFFEAGRSDAFAGFRTCA